MLWRRQINEEPFQIIKFKICTQLLFRIGDTAISFCWCYLTGEWQHDQKKAIKIKKHGRLSTSLFRYGLDYVQMAIQRLIGFGK